MKQVAGGGNNQTWIKPYWASGGILLWGPNIASENLESWRKHRRVMGPAFNSQTYVQPLNLYPPPPPFAFADGGVC